MCQVRRFTFASIASFSLLASLAAAQSCVERWLPAAPWESATASPVERAFTSTCRWDPDGPGPKPELLVFGGRFTTNGRTPVCGVLAFNPVTREWISLDGGTNTSGSPTLNESLPRDTSGAILALAAAPDGRLFAGGVFTSIGGTTVNNIAQFDGTSWTPLLGGTTEGEFQAAVQSLRVLDNGDLIVGGSFERIGDVRTTAPRTNGIARWDGTAWKQLGAGGGFVGAGGVRAITVARDGSLYAAASSSTFFTSSPVGRFDGTTWNPVPGAPSTITSMVAHPDGGVIVAGTFTNVAGVAAPGLARWDGVAWSLLPTDSGLTITSTKTLRESPNGGFRLLVNNTQPARWENGRIVADGAPLPNAALSTSARTMIDLPDGSLVVGGYYTASPYYSGAIRVNDAWEPLNPPTSNGPNRRVNITLPLPDGGVIVAGEFDRVGGLFTKAAIYDGVTWTATPWPSFFRTTCAIRSASGELFVAGSTNAGVTTSVARWNGSAWTTLGGLFDGSVFALTLLPSGELVAGGSFANVGTTPANNLARWNGTAWQAIGVGTNGPVNALTSLPNGDLVVGGGFNVVGANASGQGIMRFRGNVALTMGSGIGPTAIVTGLAWSRTGELYAAGRFEISSGDAANSVARWDGTAWLPISSGDYPRGSITSLAIDDQERAIIGGTLTGSTFARRSNVWRCEGGVWRDLGEPLESGVAALAWTPTLGIVAGGNFTRAGSTLTPYFSRLACLPNPCIVDFDTDGILSAADFFAFVDKFNAGDPATDFNQDNALTFEDFDAFVAAYAAGC